MTSKPSLPTVLVWGIFQGAAAWSAYALIEFVVSSILFGILRPYAVFTPWHWQLTGLLGIGFLAAAGVAGVGVWAGGGGGGVLGGVVLVVGAARRHRGRRARPVGACLRSDGQ